MENIPAWQGGICNEAEDMGLLPSSDGCAPTFVLHRLVEHLHLPEPIDAVEPSFGPPQVILDPILPAGRHPPDIEGRVTPEDAAATTWLLSAIVEALNGHRPIAQLARHLDERVRPALEIRVRHVRRTDPDLRILSIHLFTPAHGVIEACSTLDQGERARALAARLQAKHPGWLCTALRLG